jgi:flagellar biosynthesis anti-sigma factor FlgM
MRIGLNTPDAQNISTEKTAQSSTSEAKASGTSVASKDVFSGDTVSLSALASRVLQTPEIRQETVDSLRQAVSTGQYRLDPAGIAEAMRNN